MEPDVLDTIPKRALAIYAHPDDPDISCGGTLARWSAGGCDVALVICAAGDKGSAEPSDSPEQVIALRAGEARAAAGLLGVRRLHELGLRDGEFENDAALRLELVRLIRSHRPDVVVCPDPTAVFFGASLQPPGPPHHRLGRARRHGSGGFLAALLPRPGHRTASAVLMSGSLEPNLWVDIEDSIEAKVAAVACHKSQLADANDWFASAVRDGAEEAGRQVGVRYAEAFRRLALP